MALKKGIEEGNREKKDRKGMQMGDMAKDKKRMEEERKKMGEKRRGKRRDKKRHSRFVTACLAGCLILWGTAAGSMFPVFGSTSDPLETAGGTQGEEHLVEITTEDMLKQWYDSRLSGGDAIGVLAKNLTITKPMTLGLPEGQKEGVSIELRITQGPVRITAPRTAKEEGVVIDNPGLVITGEGSLFSLEGEGCLSLKRGQMLRSKKEEPALFLRNKSTLLWEEGKEFKGLTQREIKDERTDPSLPDIGQTKPDIEDHNGPQLVEAVLLNRNQDNSGTARLEFKNLPSDITALYLWRSEDGHSWKQEKNKVTAISSQGGNETVEYENFLKESGNTLNTSLLDDGYFIYHFEDGAESFYVKAEIEWTGGSSETYKAKIVIPDSIGGGLTFSYGGSYGGGYWGGSGDYGSYGNGGGVGGWDDGGGSFGGESPEGDSGEADAPEKPVRRGGGRRKSSYPPYTEPYPALPDKTKGDSVREKASPSQIKRPWEREELQKETGLEETSLDISLDINGADEPVLDENEKNIPGESSKQPQAAVWYGVGAFAGGAAVFAVLRIFRKRAGKKDSGGKIEK